MLPTKLIQVNRMAAAAGMSDELQTEFNAAIQDGQESGKQFRSWSSHLANAVNPAVRVALAASQRAENEGQKFAHSVYISCSNLTQLKPCIENHAIVI
jgi:hypothetical protein